MGDEMNCNISTKRMLPNPMQMSFNRYSFKPQQFVLSHDVESIELEKSQSILENEQKQRFKNRHNCLSKQTKSIFETLNLKNAMRNENLSKTAKKLENDTTSNQTCKFYRLSFEPQQHMRIEDFEEIDTNIAKSSWAENAENRKGYRKPTPATDMNNMSQKLEQKPAKTNSDLNKMIVLPHVSASSFSKRGSRLLQNIQNQMHTNTPPIKKRSLPSNLNVPSLAEEIQAVYNLGKSQNNAENKIGFVFPVCARNLDSSTEVPTTQCLFNLEELGSPELIDPINKYIEVYKKEYFVSRACNAPSQRTLRKPIYENVENDLNGSPSPAIDDNAPIVSGNDNTLSIAENDNIPDVCKIENKIQRPRVSERDNMLGVCERDNRINSDDGHEQSRSCNNYINRKSTDIIKSVAEKLKQANERLTEDSEKKMNCRKTDADQSQCYAEAKMSPPAFPDAIELLLEESDATHRGCHKFVPRHPEELAVEIGDNLYVEKEHDDLWCEGINLRTKNRGIFPTAYATDLSLLDDVNRCKFFVNFLGSIEVSHHTGNDILCHAINKLVAAKCKSRDSSSSLYCLEVTEHGVQMTDRSKKPTSSTVSSLMLKKQEKSHYDHIFLLKNITFCGYLPKNDKYFGFITKHPLDMRFACHVFQSTRSTKAIAEVVGESLRKFHQEYLALAYPTEDIYLE